MAEKMLNTRIQLKYDTLANWNSSTFKLKAGELAIVSLGETKDGTTAGAVNQHPVLFKVGTGNHTFSELPFASALAADVYAWAKASDVVLSGKVIQFKNGDNVVKSITLNYITENEATTLINNALAAYSTTEQMNAAIKVEADRAAAAEKALGERIDQFNLPENGFASKDEFNALKNLVEDEDGALARANDAYSLAETKLPTAEFNAFTSTNTKRIDDVAGSVTTLANGAVKDNTNAITAIKDHASVDSFADVMTEMAKYQLSGDYATKTEAQGYADAKDVAIKAAKDAADEANSKIDAFMSDEAKVEGAIDTLVEINQYITSDTNAFTALSERVGKLEDGTTSAKKAEYADVAASLNAAGQAQVQGIKVNTAGTADYANALTDIGLQQITAQATAADANKLGGAPAADYLKKADAPGYNDILTKTDAASAYQPKGDYASAAQGTLADSALQKADIATGSANGTISVEGSDVAVKGLGSAAYTESTAYATSAQGAKADSALQEITTTANNGLKVTNKNNIDIDTDVVFVFNCGNASTQIN